MLKRWYVRLCRFGVVDGDRYDRDTGTTVLKKAPGTPVCLLQTPSGLHHPTDEATAVCRVDHTTIIGVIREAWLGDDSIRAVVQFVGEPGWLRAWLLALERRGMLEAPEAPGLSMRGTAIRAPEADGTRTVYWTRLDALEIVEQPRRDGRFLRSFTPYRPEDLQPIRLRLPEGSIEVRG